MRGLEGVTHRRKPGFGFRGVIIAVEQSERKKQDRFCGAKESFDLIFDVIEIPPAMNGGIADQQNPRG